MNDSAEGFLTFTGWDDIERRVSFAEIAGIFNFPTEGVLNGKLEKPELDLVWKTIASTKFKAGASKGALIKHPAVRYIHKVLSNSFAVRRETGNVHAEELSFLAQGLAPLIRTIREADTLFPGLETRKYSPVKMLCEKLMDVKRKSWTTKDKTPKIFVGSFVTPILRYTNVPLPNDDEGTKPTPMDYAYLKRGEFLKGKLRERFIYCFKTGKTTRQNLLPNSAITSLATPANLLFNHAHEDPPEPQNPDAENEVSDEEVQNDPSLTAEYIREQSAPVYGIARYAAPLAPAPLVPGPTQDIFLELHRVRRENRFRDRTIRKMAANEKKRNKFTAKILRQNQKLKAALKSLLGCAGSSNATIDWSDSEEEAPEGSNTRTSRQSKRPRRNIPPPPIPSSDNESPSFSTDGEFDPTENLY